MQTEGVAGNGGFKGGGNDGIIAYRLLNIAVYLPVGDEQVIKAFFLRGVAEPAGVADQPLLNHPFFVLQLPAQFVFLLGGSFFT